MFCESKLKFLRELKILSTKDGTKEVVEDFVVFYGFLNLIQKVNFLKWFFKKWIQNERIETPGFLLTRS